MSELSIGQSVPDFSFVTDTHGTVNNQSFAGKYYIIYFYPKDDTSGCTKQASGFSEAREQFDHLNVQIIGVSKDSLAKHEKFRTKHNLNIILGSDAEGHVCEGFGVWKEKSMYGRKYMGIERTTYLVDPHGVLVHRWAKVKVTGHVESVLKYTQGLMEGL